MRTEIYKRVTDQIIEALRVGVRPWQNVFVNQKACLPLRSCGEPYKGINVLILKMEAFANDFKNPYWFTFKQAKDLGGNVIKGQKSTEIVFYKKLMVNDENSEDKKIIPMLKTYRVFNADQIENLPENYDPSKVLNIDVNNCLQPIKEAENFFNSVGAEIVTQNLTPCFIPTENKIAIPQMSQFKNEQMYYAVLGHEHVHWTGHKLRLDRDFSGRMNGNSEQKKSYAFEELIAEIGSSFLMPSLGLESLIDDNHAPYIAGYLQVLANDERAIFKAAASAQRAVDLLFDLSEKKEVKAA